MVYFCVKRVLVCERSLPLEPKPKKSMSVCTVKPTHTFVISSATKIKSLKECENLLHAVILQIRSRLLSESDEIIHPMEPPPSLPTRLSPMLRGIYCIALYLPLRGFYCDLHINEHLSVCSRYHFSRGTMFLRRFKG